MLKVVHCETLDDKQKAKMLPLINTEPDTTLPVFTGVPDSLLGHTFSMFLERMTAGTTHGPSPTSLAYMLASTWSASGLTTIKPAYLFHVGMDVETSSGH